MESSPVKKRFIESSSFYKSCDKEDPFSTMLINDSNFLDEVPNRSNCPKCNRSRKYYCYTCYVPVREISEKIPRVQLPVKIDIIKHPKEVDGKSTSTHAAVLAPDDVKIYTYPDFPFYENEKVLLIFPGKSAISFQEWWLRNNSPGIEKPNNEKISTNTDTLNSAPSLKTDKSNPSKNLSCDLSSLTSNGSAYSSLPFTKVVFIDSTWRQSKALYSDDRLRSLPCVILSSYDSLFWRPQRGKPDTYLATIEAVYYFLKELHSFMNPGEDYRGQYDNMLFFFRHMYLKIKLVYDFPILCD